MKKRIANKVYEHNLYTERKEFLTKAVRKRERVATKDMEEVERTTKQKMAR